MAQKEKHPNTHSGESQVRSITVHVDITGEEGGNSTGVDTAIRSWKRPSTDDILGASQGGVSPAGTGKRGGRCRGCDDAES